MLAEAYYEDRWHYLDVDVRAAFRRPDGSLASFEDSRTDPSLWKNRGPLFFPNDDLEHVRKIQMFSQDGVDFVLLERHMRDSPSNISGLDVRVTALDLSGDLYAVRRASGKSLWDTPLSVNPSKVLLLPNCDSQSCRSP